VDSGSIPKFCATDGICTTKTSEANEKTTRVTRTLVMTGSARAIVNPLRTRRNPLTSPAPGGTGRGMFTVATPAMTKK
jgi:hypothetical protein